VNGHVAAVDDLPDALDGDLRGASEWRVHFHVPVHRAEHTTQAELERALEALVGGHRPATHHLEIETYTWSVLPDGADAAGADERLVEGLAAELAWTRDRLLELGSGVAA